MGGRSVINEAANLLPVCGTGTTGCHGRIEASPVWARERGYRVDSWRPPEDVPVHICVSPGIYAWHELEADQRVTLRGLVSNPTTKEVRR